MKGSAEKKHVYFYSREKSGHLPIREQLVSVDNTSLHADRLVAHSCSIALSSPRDIKTSVEALINVWPTDVAIAWPKDSKKKPTAQMHESPTKYNLTASELTEKRMLIDDAGHFITTNTFPTVLGEVLRVDPDFQECIGEESDRGLQNAIDKMAENILTAKSLSQKFQIYATEAIMLQMNKTQWGSCNFSDKLIEIGTPSTLSSSRS